MSPHWAGIRGRARADAGPLLLSALVVLLVTLLAGAVPGLLRETADAAVRDAVRQAGGSADVTAQARWEPDDTASGRARSPRLADDVEDLRKRAVDELGPELRAVLRPPVASVTGPTPKVTDGSVLRTFRMAYLSDGTTPAVEWVAGTEPAPGADGTVEVSRFAPPWRVRVGVSESAAALLRVRPGALLQLRDDRGNPKNVQVSGIFRPVDRNDQVWRAAPWLLDPAAGADGIGTTRIGGLLSAGSLPDARLAFGPDDLRRTVTFSPAVEKLAWASTQRITDTAVTLKARSASSGSLDTSSSWQTQLDSVLRAATGQITAASVQASVLLTAVLAGAVLVLLLAADLLVRRRTPALVLARQRGVALPVIGAELLLESTTVAVAAAAAGATAAYLVAGAVTWWWLVPVLVAAGAAGPAYGLVVAGNATRDRRVPANRSARLWVRHTAMLRRAAAELTVLAAAVAGLVALHQRGLVQGLPAVAPTLAVLAGGLLLSRALPLVNGLRLRWALRSRRPLAVFGAAQAASGSGGVLPALALGGSVALAAFALVLGATVDRGLADGARETVGADARVDLGPDAAASTLSAGRRIAAGPGVSRVVTGQVTDTARIVAGGSVAPARLVIVDSRAFADLLEDPTLARLAPASPAGTAAPTPGTAAVASATATPTAAPSTPGTASAAAPVPAGPATAASPPGTTAAVPVPAALVRSASGRLLPGMVLEIPRDGAQAVRLHAVGGAPAVGGAEEVVIIDRSVGVPGVPGVPNTIWVSGPGAAEAVTGLNAVVRSDVLRDRRSAPLVSGLLRLTRAAAVFLLVLGLLGFLLAAAAGAPQRWQTLSRLRTLGLTPGDARRVAAGELLPGTLVAVVGGLLLGVLVAALTSGPLGLRLTTGQVGTPSLVWPWISLAVVAVAFPVAVVVLVRAESAVRRHLRLAEVLRVGG